MHSSLRPFARLTTLSLLAYLGSLGAATSLSACGDETSESTSGTRLTLKARAALAPAASQPFTNHFGWQIEVKELTIQLAELRIFEGRPDQHSKLEYPSQPSPLKQLRGFWSLSTAFAHPGHYVSGNQLAEMLTPQRLDLLEGNLELSPFQGVSGSYRSASVRFGGQPSGSEQSELGDDVILLIASASQGALSYHLELRADAADIADTHGEPTISGCPFYDAEGEPGAAIKSPGEITISFDPTRWLDQLDLSRLEDESSGEASPGATISITSQNPNTTALHNAFTRGLKQALAYRFQFSGSAE